MLEYARRQEVPKFILASTSSLYGDDDSPAHSETDPTDRPLAPYAASKKGAEAFAYSYHHLYQLDVSVLRYFTVYGPAGRPDMSMFRFCQWIAEDRAVTITGDGEQSPGSMLTISPRVPSSRSKKWAMRFSTWVGTR